MEKEVFAKITFKNFGLDYEFTVCEWKNIDLEIEAVKEEFLDEICAKSDGMQIIIQPILLTRTDFLNGNFN